MINHMQFLSSIPILSNLKVKFKNNQETVLISTLSKL